MIHTEFARRMIHQKEGIFFPILPTSATYPGSGRSSPDFLLPEHFVQLLRGEPEAFPRQQTLSPACPESSFFIETFHVNIQHLNYSHLSHGHRQIEYVALK